MGNYYGGPPSSAEPVFFSDGSCYVSRSRVVLAGTTYPVNAISSVRLASVPKGSGMLIWGIILLVSIIGSPVGVILLILYFVADDQYAVVVGSGGFERHALVSTNQQYPMQIVEAINNALATRA